MKLIHLLAIVAAGAICVTGFQACTSNNTYTSTYDSTPIVTVQPVSYDVVDTDFNGITNQYTFRLRGETRPLVVPADQVRMGSSNTGRPYITMNPDGSNVVYFTAANVRVNYINIYGTTAWYPYSSNFSRTNYVVVLPPPVTRSTYTTQIVGPGVTSRSWSSLETEYRGRYNAPPIRPSRQVSNGLSLDSFKRSSSTFKQKAETNRQAANDLRLRNRSTGGDSTTINNSRTTSTKYNSNRPTNSSWGSRSSSSSRSTSSWGSRSSSSRSGRR